MTTQEVPYGDYTTKGMDMFKKFMNEGYEGVYFKEAKKLLDNNPGVPLLTKKVLGEAQFLLYMQHGWVLSQTESRSYGQIWTYRWMSIDRAKLQKEVEDHEHNIIA